MAWGYDVSKIKATIIGDSYYVTEHSSGENRLIANTHA